MSPGAFEIDDLYPTGYGGPDIYHFDYVDASELLGETPPPTQTLNLTLNEFSVAANGALAQQPRTVSFNLSSQELGLVKPVTWIQRRRAPGEIQMARSELLQTRARFSKSLREYENLLAQIQDEAGLLEKLNALFRQTVADQNLHESRLLRHQEFLRLRHAAAKLDRMAETLQHHFRRSHRRDDIEPIRIAHVGQPKNLALQMVLSSGGRNAVLHPQVLVDGLSVDAVGRRDGGQGIAGRLLGK